MGLLNLKMGQSVDSHNFETREAAKGSLVGESCKKIFRILHSCRVMTIICRDAPRRSA